MDLNYILFIISVLNLTGDLYNSYRYRHSLPRWIRVLVASAFGVSVLSWFIAQEIAGYFSAVVLLGYLITMKTYSKSKRGASGSTRKYPATTFLIGLHLVAFAIQVYYGATEDLDKLVDLGALYPPMYYQGDWWRIVSAQFLHLGFLHVACNMLGLSFLGKVVEEDLGKVKFILGYFICGTLGMYLAMTLYNMDQSNAPPVLVGASANVIGLVGIAAAAALAKYKISGSAIAKAQLSTMVQIVLLQAVFDSLVPQVSSRAHIAGALVGFVYGMAVSYLGSAQVTRRGGAW